MIQQPSSRYEPLELETHFVDSNTIIGVEEILLLVSLARQD